MRHFSPWWLRGALALAVLLLVLGVALIARGSRPVPPMPAGDSVRGRWTLPAEVRAGEEFDVTLHVENRSGWGLSLDSCVPLPRDLARAVEVVQERASDGTFIPPGAPGTFHSHGVAPGRTTTIVRRVKAKRAVDLDIPTSFGWTLYSQRWLTSEIVTGICDGEPMRLRLRILPESAPPGPAGTPDDG